VPPQPTETPPSEPGTPAPNKPNAPEQKTEHVPQDASWFHLSTLETKNLTLLYIDPVQTYLTPYLGRAFENSLAFHEKNLKWKPWEPVTILLKDFSDYGNAAALGSPSDMVLLDVAPLSLSMEAFSPGERFFTLMNHELTHVATIDVWNSRDAFWRHFQVGANSYQYGTRFMSYIALTYGPEKLVEWLRRPEDSKAFYASQFEHVYGRSLDSVWNDWIAFEHKFQDANLAALGKYPLTDV